MRCRQTDQAVLLLGSNIKPESNLLKSIELLGARFQIQSVSSVWETTAIGSEGPNFLNAAVLLESNFSPQAMKEFVLRPIEISLERVRTHDKNAPRTMDLDVVVWDERTWDQDIWKYAHAAVPVAELIPNLRYDAFPGTLAQVARKLRTGTEINMREDITQQVRALFEVVASELLMTTGAYLHFD
jgi:2-amino-4-hydroxy-6-hydroxymethyldihydropteridine diphosphokinase